MKELDENTSSRSMLWHRGLATLVVMLMLALSGFAQQTTINLKVSQVSLESVLKQIEKQSGFKLLYNFNEVSKVREVSVNLTGATLQQALTSALAKTPLTFTINDKTIVISRRKTDTKPNDTNRKISGKVSDNYGNPIVGATVVVEGTHQGTVTNDRGEYTLNLKATDEKTSLRISYVGYRTTTTALTHSQTHLNTILTEDATDVDKVVVTGYQTLSRRESASSIATLKTDDIYMANVSSIDQMLQGQVAGMTVMNTSGEPSATPKIRIRGNSTIYGNKAPVWVVDGVILEQDVEVSSTDLNSDDAQYLVGNAIAGLSPQDIESITVLKDASATAIYGVKAANGVIVVTTKKGRTGKARISYHGDISIKERPSYSDFNLMTAGERMLLSKEIFEDGLQYNSNVYLNRADTYEGLLNSLMNREITHTEFATLSNQMAERNTDWFSVLFKNTITHNHNLRIDGGSENVNYYFSGGYTDNQGGARGSKNERFTTLSKIDVKLGSRVDFSAKIDFSSTKNAGYLNVNPFNYAYTTTRTLSAYESDGSQHYYLKDGKYRYNVLNELDNTGKDSRMNDFNGLLNLNVKLLSGLSYQGTFSYHNSSTKQRDWQTDQSYSITSLRGYEYKAYDESSTEYWNSVLPYGGIMSQDYTSKNGYTVRNTLNYVKQFDRHDLNVMVGTEARGNKYTGTRMTGYGWTPEFGEKFQPVYTTKFNDRYGKNTPTNTNSISRVASFFGTATYMYNNRYVLNFNIRSDGSNKFGSNPKYRWLPTWSIAGKWELSNESFMESFAEKGHMISLRGSYGLQGNVHEGSTPNLVVKINDRNSVTNLDEYTIYSLPNPDLRWEKTKSWNAAVDFSLWHGRVKGGLDVYHKHTTDLIMSKTVAASNGRNRLYINAGSMNNRGFEGFINVGILKSRDFDWRFNFNFGRNVNEITLANSDFYNDQDEIDMMLSGNLAVQGERLGSLYSFHYAGLSSENGYPLFYGKDGKTYHGGTSNQMEMVYCGSIYPDLSGGFDTQFTFRKRLSLNIGFAYNLGGVKRLPRIYDDNTKAFNPYANVTTELNDRWRKSGDEKRTNIPVLYNYETVSNFLSQGLMNTTNGDMNYEYPSYYYDYSDIRVAKTDYLRLKTVGISYSFNPKMLEKSGISSLQVRLQASNLKLWANKKWHGLDPELSEANIPMLPTYSLILDLSF